MSDFDPNSNKTPIFLHPARRAEMLRKGQELFNNEEFFEAHEVWENLWHVEQGRDKSFVQGLIQVAGHFVHLKKKTPGTGAEQLALAARQKLSVPPAHTTYVGLDIEPLLSAMDYNLQKIRAAKDWVQIPTEQFLFPKLFEK